MKQNLIFFIKIFSKIIFLLLDFYSKIITIKVFAICEQRKFWLTIFISFLFFNFYNSSFLAIGRVFCLFNFCIMIKIALNGFGRIGRALVRIIAKQKDVELVAINSTTPQDEMLYLLKYDSVHGNFDEKISIENNFLKIGNSVNAKIFNDRNPKNIDFGETGATILIDATGKFLTEELAQDYLKGNIEKVIFSSPAKDPNIPTYVMSVNSDAYQ